MNFCTPELSEEGEGLVCVDVLVEESLVVHRQHHDALYQCDDLPGSAGDELGRGTVFACSASQH